MATSGAVLGLAAVGWLAFWLLLRIPLVTFTLALALLVAALMAPFTGALRRTGLPAAPSALLAVLSLAAVLGGIGFLFGFRAASTMRDLTRPLTAGIDRIRVWAIEGPLGLDPQQVADIRNEIVSWIYQAAPSPTAGARMAVSVLGALVLVAFLVFFLLKDGDAMWSWLLERVPGRRLDQVDGAGRAAWDTLAHYVRGAVLVALIDAVGIGAGLLVLGVPLWLSLTMLTFVGAFIPLLGATFSGAVAVLVTLVTNDLTDAVIVLVIVLVVQQVEGNLLQPLIMGRVLHLHPAVILVAVTTGGLLFGIPGALLAVPVLAVTYRVLEYVRLHPLDPVGTGPGTREATAPPLQGVLDRGAAAEVGH
ncbi:Predicted PurR-regulated permease PerM [Blastococcus aggregatus]|uniref:Predicted PurR-regulated permease PerM n=1 Tax=Blastococcus aggregatus TaxID=38502 RepID=A0A285V7M3_9ACTN|nr:AI-2E family transporter [Blastococcus aggregatus]SOC50060.1 Predicted PurR-regulated permease PerM [Blastococcus aggregatus]